MAALLWLGGVLPVQADDIAAATEVSADESAPPDDPAQPLVLKDLTSPFFFGFGAVIAFFAIAKLDDVRREARGE